VMFRATAASLTLAACSSAPPAAERPVPPASITADAAVDAAPDAGVPEAVMAAPAWVFRYTTAQRAETWTFRHAGGSALLVVETAQGATRYTGTATEGASLVLAVSTATAKLALDCKHARRAIGAKCNDTKAKPIELLDCFHPDFAQPMPFGAAPGVEYAVVDGCTGYRLAAP
jgi:hypothetical protein